MNLRPRGSSAPEPSAPEPSASEPSTPDGPAPDAPAKPRSPAVGLAAVGVALAVIAGLATLGGEDSAVASGEAERAPVERTSLVCPPSPTAASLTTWYTGYTPDDGTPAGDSQPGEAALAPLEEHTPGEDISDGDADDADDGDEDDGDEDGDAEEDGDEDGEESEDRIAALTEPGLPVTDSTKDSGAPALGGTAEHRLAPGWTVQQTTLVDASSGVGRGLLGASCQRPDTAFWFTGASTVEDRVDYLHVINPDDAATVVDIELYGSEGRLELTVDEGVTVPAGSSVALRLDTLVSAEEHNVAARVSARSGRIGAQIQATDDTLGADWLAPVSDSEAGGAVVLPGIPADATAVRLSAFTPGDADLTLSIQFIGPTSTITPAGHESIHVRAGMVEAVDLETVTQGETGALLLTPADGEGEIKAALRVLQGEDEQEMAFIPGSSPVEYQATASGNDPGRAELVLSAPDEDVDVEITSSAGADAGDAVSETHTVAGGTTLSVVPELPEETEGRYAVTVRRTGGGELYAARVLAVERDDIPMFTVQSLPDDASTVAVPETGQDLEVISRR